MNAHEVGEIVRKTRKLLKLNQADLALSAGTATRFISDLENGKGSCQLEKTLSVLEALGLNVSIKLNSQGGNEG